MSSTSSYTCHELPEMIVETRYQNEGHVSTFEGRGADQINALLHAGVERLGNLWEQAKGRVTTRKHGGGETAWHGDGGEKKHRESHEESKQCWGATLTFLGGTNSSWRPAGESM